MAIEYVTATLIGTRTMLMSNTLPLNRHHPLTKEMKAIDKKSSKSKTEEDLNERDRLSFVLALYYDKKLGPVLPTKNIRKAAIDGARLTKEGKGVERGIEFIERVVKLEYTGPRTEAGLWEDQAARFVDVQFVKRGVAAVRPKFDEWSATFTAQVDTSVVNMDDFLRFLAKAGKLVGIGAYRSMYGRFRVEVDGRPVLDNGKLGDPIKEAA